MSIIKKAFKTLFTEGPTVFIKKFFGFVKRQIFGVPPLVDPAGYNYVVDYSRPPLDKKKLDERFRSAHKDKMVINWIICNTGSVSGGHMTIFRMINYLERCGHHNRIYIFGGNGYRTSKKIKNFFNENFIKLDAEVFADLSSIKDSDALIATQWATVYPARAIQNTRKKFYFVQDFEPWFYPMSSEYKMAENTYKFGFYGICAGPWLAKTMKENYGMPADYFDLAFEPEIYKPMEKARGEIEVEGSDESYVSKKKITLKDIKKPRIICYARPVTPRRCFELTVQGLRELFMRGLDFDLSFVGWDLSPYIIPFSFRDLKVLSHKDLAKLYNWADIGMVFSSTNYSLLPHEMMACKLPILEMKSQTTEEIFTDGHNIVLADPDPIAIADKLEWLINNSEKRKEIAENAYQYVQQFSWEKSAMKVESILKRELE